MNRPIFVLVIVALFLTGALAPLQAQNQWQNVDLQGMSPNVDQTPIRSIVVSKAGTIYVTAARYNSHRDDIFRSTDGGATWNRLHNLYWAEGTARFATIAAN